MHLHLDHCLHEWYYVYNESIGDYILQHRNGVYSLRSTLMRTIPSTIGLFGRHCCDIVLHVWNYVYAGFFKDIHTTFTDLLDYDFIVEFVFRRYRYTFKDLGGQQRLVPGIVCKIPAASYLHFQPSAG